jgi:hypothetical protein
MKGDVGRQFYSVDRRRRVGLDIQPQTTVVGSKNSVSAKEVHRLRVQRVRSFEAVQAVDWQSNQPTMVLSETPGL